MVLAVFVDGLGLAQPGAADNPTCAPGLEAIPWLLRMATPLDATMGVAGLPQSATGQAALLTGRNAAEIAGRHCQGFPGPTLRRMLVGDTVYTRVLAAGGTAAFLNTYSRAYLRHLSAGHLTASCSTLAAVAAGLPLRDARCLRRGDGIHHDLTGDALRAQGEDVPRLTPRVAAEIALKIGAANHLTLLEYFLTDPAGHSGDLDRAWAALKPLDEFLQEVLWGLGHGARSNAAGARCGCAREGMPRLVLFSDHGNIEVMSCKTHTLSPVPLAVWPPHDAAHRCTSVMDVAGLLVSLAVPP